MEIIEIGYSKPQLVALEAKQADKVNEYTVLHFWKSSEIILNGNHFEISPHACIICRADNSDIYGSAEESDLDWFRISGDISGLLLKYNLELDTVYYPKSYDFIPSLMQKFERELYVKNEFYENICEAYLNEFFIALSRERISQGKDNDIDRKTKEKLELLRRKITLEYSEKWTISDMAKIINFSQPYLYAIYKKVFGVSPMQDLISVRIEKGKMLLRESQLSVKEIASHLGYSNPSHFIRQFVKREGISPLKYRKNIDNFFK